MTTYQPDMWVVIKITNEEETFYKVFATWVGGYLTGDSWRVNSGITSVEEVDDLIHFGGNSGSSYICHKASYGTSWYSHGVLEGLIRRAEEQGAKAEVLESNTDFSLLLQEA